ncbi:MAG: DoxX family protein [Gemmataceae bacterium]
MTGGMPIGSPWWQSLLAGPLGLGLDLGLLLLRVGFSVLMMIHGWSKWQNYDAILQKGFLDPFGMGQANALATAMVNETIFAGLVAIGFLTRLSAIPLIVTMVVAAFVAHANDPIVSTGGPSKELALLYLLMFVTIFLTGPGRFSLDGLVAGTSTASASMGKG